MVDVELRAAGARAASGATRSACNYRAHAEETGSHPPELPGIFTKFPTSRSPGPSTTSCCRRGKARNDWEAELTFVLDDGGRHVARGRRVRARAGVHVRAGHLRARHAVRRPPQQFSMGKSFDTFCPIGPAIVTLDELADPADLPRAVPGQRRAEAGRPDDRPHLRRPRVWSSSSRRSARCAPATSASPARRRESASPPAPSSSPATSSRPRSKASAPCATVAWRTTAPRPDRWAAPDQRASMASRVALWCSSESGSAGASISPKCTWRAPVRRNTMPHCTAA